METKLVPFTIAYALSGFKIVTKDRRDVRIFSLTEKGDYPVLATIDNDDRLTSYKEDGTAATNFPNDHLCVDLDPDYDTISISNKLDVFFRKEIMESFSQNMEFSSYDSLAPFGVPIFLRSLTLDDQDIFRVNGTITLDKFGVEDLETILFNIVNKNYK